MSDTTTDTHSEGSGGPIPGMRLRTDSRNFTDSQIQYLYEQAGADFLESDSSEEVVIV